MPKAKFTDSDGEETVLEVFDGWSLMEAARQEDLEGIIAECGGGAICGTCHVIVDPQWADKLPPPEAPEAALLDMVPERHTTSRLSCQVLMTEALDGIEVTVPSEQLEL